MLQNRRIQGCTQGLGVTKVWPTSWRERTHTHVCCRVCQFRTAPNTQGLQRFRRPSAAASIHICIEGYTQASKFYQGFADQRTHVGCRMNHLRVVPKNQGVTGVRPTNCCCEHTHVNTSNQGCTQGWKCYKGPADPVLLQAYTCVLQNDKSQGFTQGSTVTKVSPATCCCGQIMCVAEQVNAELHRRAGRPNSARSTRVWPTNCCCEHTKISTQACTYGPRATRSWQHNCCCTQGSRVTWVWPTE